MFTCVHSEVHLSLTISKNHQDNTRIIILILNLEFQKNIPLGLQHNYSKILPMARPAWLSG